MGVQFPAHINKENGIQTVAEHCQNVSVYASKSLEEVGLSSCAELAGLLHDMGKCTNAFRDYIINASNGNDVVRGSVNHTFAGVRYVQAVLDSNHKNQQIKGLTKDIVSYAIGAHHGLFDCVDVNGNDGFKYRLQKEGIYYEEALENFTSTCFDENYIDTLFSKSCFEMETIAYKIYCLAGQSSNGFKTSDSTFYLGALSRLVLSSIVDADRKDTAEFMFGEKFDDKIVGKEIWEKELSYAEAKIATLDSFTKINKARKAISDKCRAVADLESGIYRFNVPTGAGKTLSSLRYALAHAAKWNKKRIFFVSPLLGIIDQNSKVIKNYIHDSSLILEHHSNAIRSSKSSESLRQTELYVDNWESPIVITTLVQFLNTLFSGDMSCVRRFHSLCESVIIIDEVQSVPSNILTIFNLTVSFLYQICGSSIVLCSATQPYLEGTHHPIGIEIKDMVPYDNDIWETFHRTEIQNAGACRLDELPSKVFSKSSNVKSTLVICNKRSESEFLYKELSKQIKCFHISAAMCMSHRKRVLKQINKCLLDNTEPFICVSTQVMEAGIDVSFECVIRLMAGLDNCVQAAGRCNRNGEKQSGICYVLECTDENLNFLPEINRGKNATRKLFYSDNDFGFFDSEKAIKEYYKYFYAEMPHGFQDYVINGGSSLYSMLSTNLPYISGMPKASGYKHFITQAFKEAGEDFCVFNDNSIDVIVPFGKGKDIIRKLPSTTDSSEIIKLLKSAKNYTVSMYPWQVGILDKRNAIHKIPDLDVYYISEDCYSSDYGTVANIY